MMLRLGVTRKSLASPVLRHYTSAMAITLDPATEGRIQRQFIHGAFSGPAELVAHALDDIETEAPYEYWLLRNMEAIDASLDATFAQAERDEGYLLEKCEAMMAERYAVSRAKQASAVA